MPPRSKQSLTAGRWRAIALSILVHSLIVAAAVLGWFTWKHEPPVSDALAIEASVVDERVVSGVAPPPRPAPEPAPAPPVPEPEVQPEPEPEPEPEPPPPEDQGPPKPDPAEVERRQQAEREAAEKERLDREAAEKLEAEKEAAAKAAAEKAAAEKAAAEKRAAEQKRAEEAAAARRAAEEKARLAREEELRRSLEAEERAMAARNSGEAARWHAQIVNRITRAWIRPPSAVAGVSCVVLVSQVPGGEVTSVRVDSCTVNDAALRESVEAAVLRASPLPTPPDGVPFERNLRLIFAPQ
jgi:colicin import membrane protein